MIFVSTQMSFYNKLHANRMQDTTKVTNLENIENFSLMVVQNPLKKKKTKLNRDVYIYNQWRVAIKNQTCFKGHLCWDKHLKCCQGCY